MGDINIYLVFEIAHPVRQTISGGEFNIYSWGFNISLVFENENLRRKIISGLPHTVYRDRKNIRQQFYKTKNINILILKRYG